MTLATILAEPSLPETPLDGQALRKWAVDKAASLTMGKMAYDAHAFLTIAAEIEAFVLARTIPMPEEGDADA